MLANGPLTVNFVLLHHSVCARAESSPRLLHYLINADGVVEKRLAETEQGLHRASIGVCIEGNFELAVPSAAQLAALRGLLLDIKLRYPALQLGAHRQVRGEQCTCPGKRFPMRELRAWSEHGLLEQRDIALEALIERQYRP